MPHTYQETLQQGDQLVVIGQERTNPHGEFHLKPRFIVNLKSGALIDVKAYPPPHKQHPKDEVDAVSAAGVVSEFRTGKHGETNGFALADGTEVRFPPHLSDEVIAVVSEGDRVSVNGHMHMTPKGDIHLKAQSITNESKGSLVKLNK